MDYKKAYKDALGWMRSIYPTLTGTDKEDAEHYFPELKESEDERVRNELVDFVLYKAGHLLNEDTEHRFVAYLEKQKEQPMELLEPDKNVEKIIEDVIRVYGKTQGEWVGGYDIDTLIVNLRRAFEQKEQKPLSTEETELNSIAFLEQLGYTCIPPRAEQKPTEWSEEDKTNGWTGVDLGRYLSCLQHLGTGNPLQPETINSKWFKEHCRPQPQVDLDAIAKREYERGKLDGYWEGYKKAQENMSLHYGFTTLPPINRSCLEGGPCTNPQMDCINCPRRNGNGAYTTSPNTASGESKLEAHWKPSEEQMEALKRVFYNRPIGSAELNSLESLYNDFKNYFSL